KGSIKKKKVNELPVHSDHKIDGVIDNTASITQTTAGQEDSDDGFQPALTLRKRKKNVQAAQPQIKKYKGKEKAIDAPFLPGIRPVTTRDELAIIGKKVVTQKSEEIYFPDSWFDFRVNEKGNLYFRNLFVTRIRGFFPQNKDVFPGSSTKSQLYATYIRIMLQQKHISKRLDDAVKTKVLEHTDEMFTSEQASLKQ
ncbi:hypothetical protein CU097_002268, partial [Rhizopus azygosporus]